MDYNKALQLKLCGHEPTVHMDHFTEKENAVYLFVEIFYHLNNAEKGLNT